MVLEIPGAELIENPEQYDKIIFLDCDSLALRNIDHLLEGDWDIAFQPERGKPANGRSFQAFLTEEELAAAQAVEGANSGTLAVRGAVFHEVMEAWRDIDESEPLRASGFRDQASWNALLQRHADRLEAGVPNHSSRRWKAIPFPAGEVQFPGYLDPHYTSYSRAALTHNILPDTLEKIQFTFGLYMRTFYCDPTGLFFSMLEM